MLGRRARRRTTAELVRRGTASWLIKGVNSRLLDGETDLAALHCCHGRRRSDGPSYELDGGRRLIYKLDGSYYK